MVLNITEKPEVAEKFIYFVFFKTKEKRFLVCRFKNTLETLFCTTEESEFVREEIQVTLKNYCWLFLWILAEESRNRRGFFSFHFYGVFQTIKLRPEYPCSLMSIPRDYRKIGNGLLFQKQKQWPY